MSQVQPDLKVLLAELVSSEDRTAAAQNLATELGGDKLMVFVSDPVLEIPLPVAGFPQTLPGGREWRDYLRDLRDGAVAVTELPSPYSGSLSSVAAICTGGIVFAVLDGCPKKIVMQKLVPLLPLVARALINEQKLRLSEAKLQQMRGEVSNARVLTTALDQLRRELEHALQSASCETANAEAAKREVLKANEDLALARDQALAASHAKSAFLANMSHELRTPLNAIIGYSEMLSEEIHEESAREDLKRIRDAGQHLLFLVNDILDMAKIEAGRVDLNPEAFSVHDVLSEAIVIVRSQIEKSGNSCTLEVAPEIPLLYTDRGKLRQVFLNLLSNAAKFTRDGKITISAQNSDDRKMITCSVTDTGIGMSPDGMSQLFTEFTQLDNSSTRTASGTGLGLVISQRLCLLLGGEITVKSSLGAGSSFTVRIPPHLPSEVKRAGGSEKTAVAKG